MCAWLVVRAPRAAAMTPRRGRADGAGGSIRTELNGDRARVTVVGDLDLGVRDRFMAEIGRAVAPGRTVLLDLRQVEVIDSVGLSSVVHAARMAEAQEGGHLRVLVSGEGPVKRMFELTLLHLTLDIATE